MGVHPGRPDEAADQELAEELPGLGGFRGGQTYWATIQAARRYTAPRIGRAVQRVANPVGATTAILLTVLPPDLRTMSTIPIRTSATA